MAKVDMPKLPNNSGNPEHDNVVNKQQYADISNEATKPIKKESIVKSVTRDVVNDVLVPAAKQTFINGVNTVLDIFTGTVRGTISQATGIDIGTGNGRGYYSNSPYKPYTGQTNYSAYSRQSGDNYIRSSVHDYKDIVKFHSRVDAELVLDKLGDSIAQYGRVPVRELYEYARKQTLAIDQDWGWTDISTASTYSTFDGQWKLSLPPLESLR